MSSKYIDLNIVNPDCCLFSGEVLSLKVSGSEGDLGVVYGHSPLLTKIKPGMISYVQEKDHPEELFYVSGGILEVQPNKVTILADSLIRASELDFDAANKAKIDAETSLSLKSTSVMDIAVATKELARANAQLLIINKLKNKL